MTTHPAAATSQLHGPSAATRAGGLNIELWLAGIGFVVYPLLRPFSDEVGRSGAMAFASPRWVIAHSFGIAAFILLGIGMQRLSERISFKPARARVGLVFTSIGIGLTLPYYGAEVFGLHAVGQQALSTGDWQQFSDLTHGIRWEVGIWFILLGLFCLAVGLIVLATSAWHEPTLQRWAAVPLAVGMALYIPQFATAQPIRVAHGLLMAAGCITLAVAMSSRPASGKRPGRR